MATSGDDIDKLIAGLYRAAIAPELLPEQLRSLRDMTGGSGICAYHVDLPTFNVLFGSVADVSDEYLTEYDAHYIMRDPRIGYGLRHPALQIYFDGQHTTDAAMDRDGYYRWQESHGFRYYIGGGWSPSSTEIAPISPEDIAYIVVLRSRSQGHVDKDTVALFLRLFPHIQQSVNLVLKHKELDLRLASAEHVIDQAPYGTVLLDLRGRVNFLNRAASESLSANDGVSADASGLTFATRATADAFARLFGEALVTARGLVDGGAAWRGYFPMRHIR